MESYEEHREWASNPKVDNITGLGLVAGGNGTAGFAAFRKDEPAA